MPFFVTSSSVRTHSYLLTLDGSIVAIFWGPKKTAGVVLHPLVSKRVGTILSRARKSYPLGLSHERDDLRNLYLVVRLRFDTSAKNTRPPCCIASVETAKLFQLIKVASWMRTSVTVRRQNFSYWSTTDVTMAQLTSRSCSETPDKATRSQLLQIFGK